MEWVTDCHRGAELYGRDLPRPASAADRRERARLLREALFGLWSDDLVDEFFQDRDAHARPRPRPGLPWGIVDQELGTERQLRSNLPRALPVHPHPDGVELRALGRSWVFAGAARPLLESALGGRVHTVGELLATGRPPEAGQQLELLAFLCQNDLLVLL